MLGLIIKYFPPLPSTRSHFITHNHHSFQRSVTNAIRSIAKESKEKNPNLIYFLWLWILAERASFNSQQNQTESTLGCIHTHTHTRARAHTHFIGRKMHQVGSPYRGLLVTWNLSGSVTELLCPTLFQLTLLWASGRSIRPGNVNNFCL